MRESASDLSIALIWAMAQNRVIGRNNTLPWRLPSDMQFFMATTMGKPVIMGRKTYESMKAPLPGRTNIVVTRDTSYDTRVPDAVQVAHSFDEALELARAVCRLDQVDEIMVAGGSAIYETALRVATRLYVTTVGAQIDGDTYFPEVDFAAWQSVWSHDYPADNRHPHAFTITQWDRLVAQG